MFSQWGGRYLHMVCVCGVYVYECVGVYVYVCVLMCAGNDSDVIILYGFYTTTT